MIYSKRKAFKRAFNSLVIYVICIDEFEIEWKSLFRIYHLKKNKFLKRLFIHKKKWTKAIFHGDILCGHDKHIKN